MKEKIERFSKGDFEYELPFISLSEDEIRITMEAGKTQEGKLTIRNSADRSMKGVLYTSNRLFTLEQEFFCGVENTITYQFNAAYLKAGDVIQGELSIICDCGEHKLPFCAQVEAPYCNTSIGKVKDLFQFANLARMDWTEAKKVFRSEDFERVILKNEEKYRLIYRNLLKSISTSQALEEFLIAIHKKSKIELSIDKTFLQYQVKDEEIMDKLILTKNDWGYSEIRVSTDEPFIQLEQKFVWADRFIGNFHQIVFHIIPNQMRPGNNYGRIWVKTVHQTIMVDVVCKNHKAVADKKSEDRRDRKTEYKLTKKYLDFRMDQINLTHYAEDTEKLLAGLSHRVDSSGEDLMRIHLAIISGKNKLASQLLSDLAQKESSLRKNSILKYCAYLYLEALHHKDDMTIKHVTDTIRRYYQSGHYDWRILWFLLYTDRRYDKNKSLKLEDIREQFDAGCRSPIMYYEAVLVYNEEPYLLRDLSDFELLVFHFGIKNGIITEDAARQYTYLANRRKSFHPIIFKGLTQLYEKYKEAEILTAICCMLIKGLKKSAKYFKWYSLAVEAQLRITELYEYYMYSVEEEMEKPLSQSVLLYFIYNSSLNDKKRAFLYANIIKYKEQNEAMYRTYYKKMEVFTLKQLEAHNISPNLAVLYQEFLQDSIINCEMAEHLPYVMFTHEIKCDNQNMVAVSVIHKEMDEEEETIPLTEGKARVQLYTGNAEIFLVDTIGNRFTVSVQYTHKPLLAIEKMEGIKIESYSHSKLLLHLFEAYQSNRVMSEKAIYLRKQVLLIPGLKEVYFIDCLLTLIDYYYENYDEAQLEEYLLKLDLSKVKERDRIKFLEYMVVRGYYEKALGALENFGFEGISVKRLVRLCSSWIMNSGIDKKERLLVTLCYYIFTQGKYDETILMYLVKHYFGPTDNMYSLWQAAKGFEVEAHRLEERLLVQMLFAEGYTGDSFQVFQEYYKNVTNHLLVKAFLTFYAYKYLVHDRVISAELFPIMRRELNYEENEICLLAWMKYNSNNPQLSENELDFVSCQINRMVKKGIVLPFFLEYQQRIRLPERITDKFYIEYKTNPKKQVYLHYRLMKADAKEEYITERMPNVFLGIHVKEYVLFYHEILQYYITEEMEDEVIITESYHLHFDREIPVEEESKYNHINLMLMALEMKDEQTLLNLMEHYVKSEYLMRECFSPLK